MKMENQSFEILTEISPNAEKELRLIEEAGRICYKSKKGDFNKCKKFVKTLIARGHESVLEHSILTVKFITSRTVTHQLVRHRLCSFSQESQRYCNYSQGRFGGEITFIPPVGMSPDELEAWKNCCANDEREYMEAIAKGRAPESARAILPNCVKTEIVVTANYREWRHLLRERTSIHADPNMRALMTSLLVKLYFTIPVVFEDFKVIG